MYMAKQIKDSLTMKPVGILRASIKLSYLKMTITARDSLAAHIFLLDNDKNVLIESAENDATISDRSWIEISGNTGRIFCLLQMDRVMTVYIREVLTQDLQL